MQGSVKEVFCMPDQLKWVRQI